MKKHIFNTLANLEKLLGIVILSFFFVNLQAKDIGLVASPPLKQIAVELSEYLKIMYSDDRFFVVDVMPELGDVIVLITDPDLESEEFHVSSISNKDRVILTISGGSLAGVKFGTYKFLEELGCGFYLSFEIIPKLDTELRLDEICFSDTPLVKNRLVFNWHNFLSGCSSWDFADWKQYIDNASKMGFNGLMTHFYANDPSFTFSYNGIKKIAGYMPNTLKGRQYGTQQVNDVIRMVAGEIFADPVFGSDASKVPDNKREQAAKGLMQRIHKYAISKAMKIWMGFDVDYPLANPPEIIASFPSHATINIERTPSKYFGMPYSDIVLPIPDSPEGYAYYKSQIRQLFKLYPEINNLVLWTRTAGSAFLTLRYDEFPEKWKEEFDKISESNSKVNKADENITGRFATGKIYYAVRKALDETGKKDIKLWAGSWRVSWLEQADLFYPPEVGFIPLDYDTDFFSDPEKFEILQKVSRNRELIPVVWAHHDDGSFIGSPFIPYEGLQLKIAATGNSGFGIIHWTTKPLDIYFKNAEQQIWKRTANASLETTAKFMAVRLVSSEKVEKLSKYLVTWVKEGPRFGRETRTYFFDLKISDFEFQDILQKCKQRIQLIDEINEADNPNIQYFKDLEEFCILFYTTQYYYQKALSEVNSGNNEKAINFIKKCEPEAVIKKYAKAANVNNLTKGEQGVVLELNLSWLPQIYSLQQTLRQREVRYNFGWTNFPDLGVGLLETNYFIDENKNLWRNLGERETGGIYFFNDLKGKVCEGEIYNEICSSGVKSNDSLFINLSPIGNNISPANLLNPNYFLPGKYQLTLIFNEPAYSKMGDRIFEIEIKGGHGKFKTISETIDIISHSGRSNNILCKKFIIDIFEKENLQIVIKSLKGACLINGLVFEPVYI